MFNQSTCVYSPVYIGILTLLTALLMFIDGYDLQVMALVAAPIAQSWSVPVANFGIVHSAAVAGMGIGALGIGPLGDRHGRRNIILFSFGLIIVSVALSGFASSVTELVVWRLLTGVGLGGMLANAAALLAEFLPEKRRSLLLTLAGSGITVGAISSGLLVPYLLTHYQWPSAFWVSAVVSAAIWLLLAFFLPEAPSFRSRKDSAHDGNVEKPTFFSVLKPEYRWSTLALWVLFIGNSFLIYILVSWIPVLMNQQGWDLSRASSVIVYFQGGGLLGGVVVAALMDRWNPYCALLSAYVLAAVCLLCFGVFPESYLTWGILFFLVGAGISGVHMTINAMAAVVYPVSILSSAIGFTVAVARAGAIAAPIIGGFLISRNLGAQTFMLWQLLPVCMCVLSVLVLRTLSTKSKAPVSA